jgi:hypothetical protein
MTSFVAMLSQILAGIFLLVVAQVLRSCFYSPLKSIPGPFLAKFTNLWRLLDTYNGRAELTQRTLHEKYGPAVRIGPNAVSLSDPSLLRTIYNIRGDFLKVSAQNHSFGTQSNESTEHILHRERHQSRQQHH